MAKTRQQIQDELRQKYKGRRLSAYGIGILEDVPGIQPEDTDQIEEVMRDRHSTLDHLDHPTFRREARQAWKAVQELRKDGVFKTPVYAVLPSPVYALYAVRRISTGDLVKVSDVLDLSYDKVDGPIMSTQDPQDDPDLLEVLEPAEDYEVVTVTVAVTANPGRPLESAEPK